MISLNAHETYHWSFYTEQHYVQWRGKAESQLNWLTITQFSHQNFLNRSFVLGYLLYKSIYFHRGHEKNRGQS